LTLAGEEKSYPILVAFEEFGEVSHHQEFVHKPQKFSLLYAYQNALISYRKLDISLHNATIRRVVPPFCLFFFWAELFDVLGNFFN